MLSFEFLNCSVFILLLLDQPLGCVGAFKRYRRNYKLFRNESVKKSSTYTGYVRVLFSFTYFHIYPGKEYK